MAAQNKTHSCEAEFRAPKAGQPWIKRGLRSISPIPKVCRLAAKADQWRLAPPKRLDPRPFLQFGGSEAADGIYPRFFEIGQGRYFAAKGKSRSDSVS